MGSSISATGSLLVNCNVPYTLEVNGVLWSPIGMRDGADEYVVSSSGEFVIRSNDDRIFFFRNTIEQDFAINSSRINFVLNNDNVGFRQSEGSYVQTSFMNCDKASCLLTARDKTLEELQSLTPSVSQGVITEMSISNNRLIIRMSEISTSSYLQVKLGNVLIAFITPLN